MDQSADKLVLADRIEAAYRDRLDQWRPSQDDLAELVGNWWLCGEKYWLRWIGYVLPLYLRADWLTEEQLFHVDRLVEHLDGLSFDGSNDRDGTKLRDISKVQARAWRSVVPTMTAEEKATLIEFLKSPYASYDPEYPELVQWWEWAAVNLVDTEQTK